MLNALGLGILFQAKDEVSEVAEKLKDNLHELGEKAEKAHGSLLTAFLTSPAGLTVAVGALGAVGAGLGFELAEHAEKFSSAILRAGVAAHASAGEIKEFEEIAKTKAFDQMRGSAVETADVLQQLAQEGFNLKEAGQSVDATLTLMRISMGALGSRAAAGLVHDTLAEFHMDATQSVEVVDKFAYAMQAFKFRAEELQPAMSGLASGANLLGASFDDTLIGVGLLKEVFPSASKAASGMNVALQQLASTHTQTELKGIGVAVKDLHGKTRPLLDILTDLSTKTRHYTDAQLDHKLASIGSARAAGGLAVIIDSLRKGVTDASGQTLTGAAALEHYREELAKTQGTAKRMADMLGGDLGSAVEALKGAISNLGVESGLGGPEGFFTKAIQSANLFVRGITQLFSQGGFSGDVKDQLDKHLGIKGFAEGVFIWIKRIENFFTNLSDVFSATFATFGPLLDTLGAAFGELGQALGITSQGADDNASTWDKFSAAGATVGSVLANVAGAVIPVVTAGIEIMTEVVREVQGAWEVLGPTVMNVANIFGGVFRMIGGLFSGNWKALWDGFIDVVTNAGKAVINILMGTVGRVGSIIDALGSAFGKDLGIKKGIDGLKSDWLGSMNDGGGMLKSVVGPGAAAGTGAAAIKGQAAATAAATAPLMSMMPEGEQMSTTHVHVNLDGEKVGEAVVRGRRSSRARSFEPVSSGGG